MSFKIGFNTGHRENEKTALDTAVPNRDIAPVKSVVQVFFPGRNMKLAYYNDMFDLRRGDIVYVDGKLEGMRGRVVDVTLNFKIKISDYKRVIARADTDVHGEFQMAGTHLVTFDPSTLPFEKALSWFKAPAKEDEEYVSGCDGSSFPLDNLSGMKAEPQIAERGQNYYMENKVVYIGIDGTHGQAIVEGTQAYELEFEYESGEISNLVCGCFCSGTCKHEVAAMLQLCETLELIEKNFAGSFSHSGYFAAISKTVLFSLAIDGKERGSFTL